MGLRKGTCIQILAYYEELKLCLYYKGASTERFGTLVCACSTCVYLHPTPVSVPFVKKLGRRGRRLQERKEGGNTSLFYI